MKIIGIDARLYSQTGVGTYLKNLLYHLNQTKLRDLYYIYLTKKDYDQVKFSNKHLVKKIADYHWHGISEQTQFLFDLYRDNLDLMHFTYFSYPILYCKKFVVTIHDLTPLLFKTGRASTKNPVIYEIKHWFFKLILIAQVKLSQQIITPTNMVKNQLINTFGSDINHKIITIYEGINYQLVKTKENAILKKIYNNFFLYVGNFYPHKNVERLVRAFLKASTDSQLLLVGPNDFFTNKIRQLIKHLNGDKKIMVVDQATKEDLVFFYKNCQALIHPSLSEGFGLPIVETMYFNRPIIASNIEVFKELLKDGYISFNPFDEEDITAKINEFIKKPKTFDYHKIINRYSFQMMTKKMLNIYMSSH